MSIVEFAEKIGVSPTTVSRAISGRGRVSASTREMVLRRMKELGYTPNPHARQLVTGRSQMIVLHHMDREILADMFLVELARGVQHALRQHDYGLVLDTDSGSAGESTQLRRWIRSRAVDGVIIKSLRPVYGWVQQIADPRVPFVVIGDSSVSHLPHVGTVLLDTEECARQVAQIFYDNGHRRIGYVGSWTPDNLLNVFRQHLETLGVPLREERIVIGGKTHEDGAAAARELLFGADAPTAIFARTDALAIGVMHEARRQGIAVPEQLSLVGFGDVPFASVVDPPLTTVHVDFFALGRIATEMLLNLVGKTPEQPLLKHVGTTLIVRESTSVAPDAARGERRYR